jgi:hypothetical protein
VDLNTYRSTASPAVYVTMPAREAAAIIAIVDRLEPMRLTPVRCGYTLSDDGDMAFREFVTIEIAATGYAVHGFDPAFS